MQKNDLNQPTSKSLSWGAFRNPEKITASHGYEIMITVKRSKQRYK